MKDGQYSDYLFLHCQKEEKVVTIINPNSRLPAYVVRLIYVDNIVGE